MSRRQSELEGRLDDMLSRIAMETQEIKELEQQLTDGQILANEVLQRDLEGIISGLQEYLRGLRDQARRSQQQVDSLQAENQSLQLHLEDSQRHCRQLEDRARTHTQDMSVQQEELSVLRTEAHALRDRQVESSRQQEELEVELQQLREELARQVTLGQLERGALLAAVDKEKQSTEIRECQLQATIDTLQDEKSSLQQITLRLQAQLDQTRTQYTETRDHLDQTRLQLDRFTAAMLDPQEVQSGPDDLDEDKYRYHYYNFIFQQDLAPAQTARSTKTWFDVHAITVLDWPANSPDLNPTENLWGILKRKMRGTRPNNKEELTASIKEIWASITPRQCHVASRQ
ncbi:centriolin-like [Seriola lalandi dorsalis]|uniref:centriolin-like n=1 Tax=Seriola lalandi dorsalis TaxID=1841481 RepID=UPI000C6FAA70|nr:centriolin-like [Seriola lalandi dorsalis]